MSIILGINAYHGVTLGATSMTGKPYIKEFGMPLNDFIHADCPHYWKYGLPKESEEDFSIRMAKNLEDLIINNIPIVLNIDEGNWTTSSLVILKSDATSFEALDIINYLYEEGFILDRRTRCEVK